MDEPLPPTLDDKISTTGKDQKTDSASQQKQGAHVQNKERRTEQLQQMNPAFKQDRTEEGAVTR